MTNSSDKFCLQWNDFQQNIATTYQDLRKYQDFCDVTLVCEEGKQIEAHRIILSASSTFFNTLLKRNINSHPLIYMRGLKAKELTAIVDFIYHGETNIYQNDLDGFLALAEELQLKGLDGTIDKPLNNCENLSKKHIEKQPKKEDILKQECHVQTDTPEDSDSFTTSRIENHHIVPVDNALVAADTTMDNLKVKLDSIMGRVDEGEYKWKCTVCGMVRKNSKDMRRHIESHIEGLSFPCNQCDKISSSSHA